MTWFGDLLTWEMDGGPRAGIRRTRYAGSDHVLSRLRGGPHEPSGLYLDDELWCGTTIGEARIRAELALACPRPDLTRPTPPDLANVLTVGCAATAAAEWSAFVWQGEIRIYRGFAAFPNAFVASVVPAFDVPANLEVEPVVVRWRIAAPAVAECETWQDAFLGAIQK